MPLRWMLVCLLGMLCAACSLADEPGKPPRRTDTGKTTADSSGAISMPRMEAPPNSREMLASTEWTPANIGEGKAWISCDADYSGAGGDGKPLSVLLFFSVVDAMDECRSHGVVRLRYQGKIDAGFADLVERVSAMAERMEITNRILDVDSAGGQVEDAMRAGDAIAANRWTLWVREGSVCHSACVLILAAGDNRLISGEIGIHRMIRLNSAATTRQELNAELQQVHSDLSDYLQRNGAATAIADLMMAVPSRDLRLLKKEELHLYGLLGANAAQADLERVQLVRKCGIGFLGRKEAFQREFEAKCMGARTALEDMNHCGRQLRKRFGFPDDRCPDDSPMAEIDGIATLESGDAGAPSARAGKASR